MAIGLGKHVYCEKPLTHSVYEARKIGRPRGPPRWRPRWATRARRREARVIPEMIRDGAIGNLREVHAWSNRLPDISRAASRAPPTRRPSPRRSTGTSGSARRPSGPTTLVSPVLLARLVGLRHRRPRRHRLPRALDDLQGPEARRSASVEACSTNWQRPKEISDETARSPPSRTTASPRAIARPLSIFWYDGGMRPPRPMSSSPASPSPPTTASCTSATRARCSARASSPTPHEGVQDAPKTLPRSPGHHRNG